eukprot:scaffold16890_cov110-Isochrysis_galbana.AAC.3
MHTAPVSRARHTTLIPPSVGPQPTPNGCPTLTLAFLIRSHSHSPRKPLSLVSIPLPKLLEVHFYLPYPYRLTPLSVAYAGITVTVTPLHQIVYCVIGMLGEGRLEDIPLLLIPL